MEKQKFNLPIISKVSTGEDLILKRLKLLCKKYRKSNEYVFKSVIYHGVQYIVVMKRKLKTITNESREVADKNYAMYRGNIFLVVDIINIYFPTKITKSIINETCNMTRSSLMVYIYTKYAIGKDVVPDTYDEKLSTYSNGIYFFRSIEAAYCYILDPYTSKYTGTHYTYHDNGNMEKQSQYTNGKLNGLVFGYYRNGNIRSESEYIDGKINGIDIWYYLNGRKRWEYMYVEGFMDGFYTKWLPNGEIKETGEFTKGKLL